MDNEECKCIALDSLGGQNDEHLLYSERLEISRSTVSCHLFSASDESDDDQSAKVEQKLRAERRVRH